MIKRKKSCENFNKQSSMDISLQNHRRCLKLIATLLLIFILFFSSSICFADNRLSGIPSYTTGDDYYFGKVDILDFVKIKTDALKKRLVEAASRTDQVTQEHYDHGFFIENIMANSWIITRSVVNGFTNMQSVVNYLQDEADVPGPAYKLIYDYLLNKDIIGTNNPGGAHFKNRASDEEIKKVWNNSAERAKFKAQPAMQTYVNFTKKIQELIDLGYFGSDGSMSIMDRTRFISAIFLCVAYMSYIAYLAWTSLVKEPVPPSKWFQVSFRFALLMLFLFFIQKLVMFGVSMSDGIRNFMTTYSYGTEGNSTDLITELLHVRSLEFSTGASLSFLDFFTKGVAQVISSGMAYLAYFVSSAVLYIIVLLADILMSITAMVGPITVALSMLPTMEDSLGNWFKGYVSILFFGPMSTLYGILLVAIFVAGFDKSTLAFITVCVAYVMGALKVPNLARNLAGTALAGISVGVATMPGKFTTTALTGGVRGAFGKVTG